MEAWTRYSVFASKGSYLLCGEGGCKGGRRKWQDAGSVVWLWALALSHWHPDESHVVASTPEMAQLVLFLQIVSRRGASATSQSLCHVSVNIPQVRTALVDLSFTLKVR